MKKLIYLKLDTYYGVITIPFQGLKDVDDWTVRYDTPKKLIQLLIDVLKLPIDLYDVNSIYLTYDRYNRGIDEECLCIKYSGDNFNYQSLSDVFYEYIIENPKRILESDIKYVNNDIVMKYFNSGKISNFEIRNLVNAYLSDERGYKRKRDTYFYLKDRTNGDIKIKVDPVLMGDAPTRKGDLSSYDPEDDSYLSHLIQLAKRGGMEFDRAMELIGSADLSELSQLLKHRDYGIVDGVSDLLVFKAGDVEALEAATGISIEKLREEHTRFGRKKRS